MQKFVEISDVLLSTFPLWFNIFVISLLSFERSPRKMGLKASDHSVYVTVRVGL